LDINSGTLDLFITSIIYSTNESKSPNSRSFQRWLSCVPAVSVHNKWNKGFE
jgi:hypothetical protein